MKLLNSKQLYDKFAPSYRGYSEKKEPYLKKIEEIISSWHFSRKNRVLDVGCGDGIRGIKIFKKAKFKAIDFIDSSEEMVKLCKKNTRMPSYTVDISTGIPDVLKTYDAVLCLWNVMGHIPTEKKRQNALINMAKLLTKHGYLFMDISNRYNMNYYGYQTVLNNIKKDYQNKHESGDVSYEITLENGEKLPTSSHFFTSFEIEKLVNKAGLAIEKVYYIDYQNGTEVNSFFEGQLFYVLSK
jgi:2-polyprenyl-3-methyl-5-hydroxy-6-metoxy-1,4-benzoquinol methylase